MRCSQGLHGGSRGSAGRGSSIMCPVPRPPSARGAPWRMPSQTPLCRMPPTPAGIGREYGLATTRRAYVKELRNIFQGQGKTDNLHYSVSFAFNCSKDSTTTAFTLKQYTLYFSEYCTTNIDCKLLENTRSFSNGCSQTKMFIVNSHWHVHFNKYDNSIVTYIINGLHRAKKP